MKKILILFLCVLCFSACQPLFGENSMIGNLFSSSNQDTNANYDAQGDRDEGNERNNHQDEYNSNHSAQASNNDAQTSSVIAESISTTRQSVEASEVDTATKRAHNIKEEASHPNTSANRDADGVANYTAFEMTDDECVIFDRLKTFAIAHIRVCNKNITPCRDKPKREHVRTGQVEEIHLTYIQFDENRIDLQLLRSQGPHFPYLAKCTFTEMYFVAKGRTEAEALENGYKMYASRKVTELPRYMKNKWVQ